MIDFYSVGSASDVFFGRVWVGKLPKLRVRVRPRRVQAGLRVRFRFRVTYVLDGVRHRLRGARVRFAGLYSWPD